MNGIWSVLSGALTQEKRLEVLTNNLANANTTAFKKDRIVLQAFTPLKQEPATAEHGPELVPTFNMLDRTMTLFHEGAIRETADPLDLAIEGEGFFAIQTPGGVRYTRDGNFTMDIQGQLVNQAGFPVLGDGGSILLPPGKVTIGSDGKIFVDKEEVASLATFEFSDKNGLKKVGGSLYEAVRGGATPSPQIRVRQGALEMSNVNTVEEMVTMMSALRTYESTQRSMLTAIEVLGKGANEVGRVA